MEVLGEVNTLLVVKTQREALGTNVSHDVIRTTCVRSQLYPKSNQRQEIWRICYFFLRSYFKLCVCMPACGQVPMEPRGIRSPGLK